MTCQVCKHNQIKIIDRALLAGADLTSLSRTYGFDVPSLRRHQEHLQRKMAQASQRFHANLHQVLFCKLTQVMEMVFHVVREAKKGGDFKFFLQASREFSRVMSLTDKMAAKLHLDPEFIYCLMASHQWDLQEESLLPAAFVAVADHRQSLKVNLFASCPETPPEPEPTAALNPSLGTANSELKTTHADPHGLPLDPPENPTVSPAQNQRQKSAKCAPKTRRLKQNNKKNQMDNLEEKNVPNKRENLFQKLFRRWEKSGKKAGKTSYNYVNN
jgi:hypothetical protein